MEKLIKKVMSTLTGSDDGAARRRAILRQSPACEQFEGRQLLSTGLGGLSQGLGQGLGHRGLARGLHRTAQVARHGVGHKFTARNLMGTATPQGIVAPTSATPTLSPADPNAPTNASAVPSGTSASSTPSTSPDGTTAAATTSPNAPPITAATRGQSAVDRTQLQADITQLQTDTHAILAKSQVTVAQRVALQDDIQAIQKASTSSPSQATVEAFRADIQSLQGTLPTADQKAKLVEDFTAMVKSQGVTDQTLIDKAISDSEAIVTASGITADDLAKLAADHKAIDTDLGRTSSSTLTQATPTGGPLLSPMPDLASALGGSFGGPLGDMEMWGGPIGMDAGGMEGTFGPGGGMDQGSGFYAKGSLVVDSSASATQDVQDGFAGGSTMVAFRQGNAFGQVGSNQGFSMTSFQQGGGSRGGTPMRMSMPNGPWGG